MTDREYFVKTIADETPRFERVFTALPTDKLDYKPHPQSRSAMELAGVLAVDAISIVPILKTGVIDFSGPQQVFKDLNEIIKTFFDNLAQVQAIAEGMHEADWASEARMMAGEKEEWKTTKGVMTWGILLDLIHHRGQLTVYIRPMGGKVPSVYGPSGDTNG